MATSRYEYVVQFIYVQGVTLVFQLPGVICSPSEEYGGTCRQFFGTKVT